MVPEKKNDVGVVPETLNPAVAEKAREAVALAMTVLGMSRTDVVDTYNHLARQHGIDVGTELDSSKVWLKFYRGVQSAIGFDQGLERVEHRNNKQEIIEVPRERLADDSTLEIVKEHSDQESLAQLSNMHKASKDIEWVANRGATGHAGDAWESTLGEMVANVAIAGKSAKEAVKTVRVEHNDMKEVGKMVPEAYFSGPEGKRLDITASVTRSITDGSAEVSVPRTLSSLTWNDYEHEHDPESARDHGHETELDMDTDELDADTAGARPAHTNEDLGLEPTEDEKEVAAAREERTKAKQTLVEGLHAWVADRFSDRDYAGFRYISEGADDYLDHKLMPDRRGEGKATHALRSSGVFGGEERKAPEFIRGLVSAFGFEGTGAPDANARKTLSRLEAKLKTATAEVERMLEKGITPPITERAQQRMEMPLSDLSRQIQR